MADSLPTPPSPEQAPAPAAPAFDPKAIVDAFVAVLTKPADFFASPTIQNQKGFPQPLIFAVAMGLAAGVIGAILAILHLGPMGGMVGVGIGLLGIILLPIYAVIGAFVGGAIVHVIALIGGGKGTYEHSVRIACYSMAVFPVAAILKIIPFLPLDLLAQLYGLYIIALGVIALHGAKRQTTFIVVGILGALALIFGVVGFFAARTAMGALQQLQQAAEAAKQQ